MADRSKPGLRPGLGQYISGQITYLICSGRCWPVGQAIILGARARFEVARGCGRQASGDKVAGKVADQLRRPPFSLPASSYVSEPVQNFAHDEMIKAHT